MASALPIDLAGTACLLDGRRALYWHAAQTLVLADVHLGKGEAFRRQGVAIPSGHTQADCDAIEALLDDYRPQRLVVCGDLFHDRIRGDEGWLAALQALCHRHRQLAFDVVLGNHDRKSAALPDLGMHWHAELVLPPFVFHHEPQSDPRGYVLAGHLHPVVRLRGMGDALRLPVFWQRAEQAVLPAFGSFTGGMAVEAAAGERLYALSESSITPLAAGTGAALSKGASRCVF